MFIKKKYWKKTIVSVSAVIDDAIKSLNNSGLQVVIVVNDSSEFVGTITDGDIRRGLINGLNLKSSIKKILKKKAIISKTNIDANEAENILRRFDILHLPIIKKKKYQDFILREMLKLKKII